MPPSLWAATTVRPEPYPLLRGEVRTDVCIIGGGFMGLGAALALAEQGVSVVLLEAAAIGWGASGRNNGLVAPGLKRDPWQVRRLLGPEAAEKLLRYSAAAPKVVFKLIDRHNIECDADRGGWIQAAHSRRALRVVERRVIEWQKLGSAAELIAEDDLAQQLGTAFYCGACRYVDGGSINPLAYAYGLAAAAESAGATIHEQSPALHMERMGGRWAIASNEGSVVATQVLCCTNAYNAGIEKLRGTVLPLRTAQVASQPLDPDLAERILPGAAAASDTQRLLTSFRLTADNRLIMGGASATAGDQNANLMTRLHTAASTRFDFLAHVSWEWGWSGYLALTPDHLPRILRIDDGFLAAIACNGRGIAMATSVGHTLAEIVCGLDQRECSVPIRAPKRFAGFSLRTVGVAAGVRWNRFLDAAERRFLS